ncbi:MAG TPA: hypothetical protein VIC71_11065 [Gammaproteobacteria bacterium]
MRSSIRTWSSIAAVALVGVCWSFFLGAQPASAPPEVSPIPRTADGKPNLSGIWIANGALMLYAGEDAAAAARAADAAIGRAPNPPAEPPPYRPEAEAKRQEYLARLGIDDPMARCLLTGVPRIQFRPLPFEIIQLPDRIVILYEIHHAFRIIPTDGRGHPDDMEPTYLGDSVAHWEGDTLVVDVTGFNTGTWLQGVGTIHSEQLRVTERYTRDTFDTIRYAVTMEDPAVFTKPWTLYETFRLRANERIREYECIESNEDLLRFEKLIEESAPFIAP